MILAFGHNKPPAIFMNGGQFIYRLLVSGNGERDRIRTCDPVIKSHLLYQLSYAPAITPHQTDMTWQKTTRGALTPRALWYKDDIIGCKPQKPDLAPKSFWRVSPGFFGGLAVG